MQIQTPDTLGWPRAASLLRVFFLVLILIGISACETTHPIQNSSPGHGVDHPAVTSASTKPEADENEFRHFSTRIMIDEIELGWYDMDITGQRTQPITDHQAENKAFLENVALVDAGQYPDWNAQVISQSSTAALLEHILTSQHLCLFVGLIEDKNLGFQRAANCLPSLHAFLQRPDRIPVALDWARAINPEDYEKGDRVEKIWYLTNVEFTDHFLTYSPMLEGLQGREIEVFRILAQRFQKVREVNRRLLAQGTDDPLASMAVEPGARLALLLLRQMDKNRFQILVARKPSIRDVYDEVDLYLKCNDPTPKLEAEPGPVVRKKNDVPGWLRKCAGK